MSLVVAEPSLSELANTANREHLEVEKALNSAVEHAYRAGAALNAAALLVPVGEWKKWCKDNFTGSRSHATLYRRMDVYRSTLESHGVTLIRDAMSFLRDSHLYLERRSGGRKKFSEEQFEEMRLLRKTGMSYQEIAAVVGCSKTTAQYAVDERKRVYSLERTRKNDNRRRQAARDLRNKEEAKAAGGEISKAYELVRSLATTLDLAVGTTEGDRRRTLKSALTFTYRAEDAIGKAVRTL